MRLASNKKLIAITPNTNEVSAVITHADTVKYYDRVALPFASLCYYYLDLDISYLVVIFYTMQMMTMHLRIKFIMSKVHCIGIRTQFFQGYMQRYVVLSIISQCDYLRSKTSLQ